MSSYIGKHAHYYDTFYSEKPYQSEADFVHRCLQENNIGETKSLLEICCGTGRHAIALSRYGYDIVATDYSKDMLECAKQNGKKASVSIDFRLQDMRSLDLEIKSFDAAICLFDSIGYAQTNEAINKVFQGIQRHLRPNGLFLFEFWHAAAMLCSYDPVRVKHFTLPDRTLLRISKTELDYAKQLAYVEYTIYELNLDGTYATIQERQTNRFFLLAEMSGFLCNNGFKPLKWYAGFMEDQNISEKTWHIVCLAQRA